MAIDKLIFYVGFASNVSI